MAWYQKRDTNEHLWDTFVFFFVEAAKIAFRETWSCNKSLSLNFCIETPLNNVPMPSSKAKLRIILLGQKCQFPKAILNNLYVRHILYFTSDKITFPPWNTHKSKYSRNASTVQFAFNSEGKLLLHPFIFLYLIKNHEGHHMTFLMFRLTLH